MHISHAVFCTHIPYLLLLPLPISPTSVRRSASSDRGLHYSSPTYIPYVPRAQRQKRETTPSLMPVSRCNQASRCPSCVDFFKLFQSCDGNQLTRICFSGPPLLAFHISRVLLFFFLNCPQLAPGKPNKFVLAVSQRAPSVCWFLVIQTTDWEPANARDGSLRTHVIRSARPNSFFNLRNTQTRRCEFESYEINASFGVRTYPFSVIDCQLILPVFFSFQLPPTQRPTSSTPTFTNSR